MALLTPDEVLNKKFQVTKFREGYDMVEVDDFLDLVLATLRAVYVENDEVKAKLEAAETRVSELSRTQSADDQAPASPEVHEPEVAVEQEVAEEAEVAAPAAAATPAREPEMATGIIQMAQQLHDNHVRAGQEEGDRLVTDARNEGNRIVREAEETSTRTLHQLEIEKTNLESKIDELRTFERDYRVRLKSYLQNLLGDLDQNASKSGPEDTQI